MQFELACVFNKSFNVSCNTNFWSRHRRCSVKKSVLKNFGNFTGKHLCWSLFLIKLQAFRLVTLSKRDSNTDVFLEICKTFKINYFKELMWATVSAIPRTSQMNHWITWLLCSIIWRYSHANWKSIDKWSLTTFRSVWKFRIPTSYNVAVIYPWNLLFS